MLHLLSVKYYNKIITITNFTKVCQKYFDPDHLKIDSIEQDFGERRKYKENKIFAFSFTTTYHFDKMHQKF